MTRRRWIADEFSADRAALTGEHAAHLSRTLRARIGQKFEVACGDQVRLATVSNVADNRVEFALGEEVAASEVVPITLLLAIFKFDRMEWAIEKCTELNVTTIVPVIARRTEKHLALAAEKRVERWRRVARQAAEQSRRTTPPEIAEPLKLKEALGTDSLGQALSEMHHKAELFPDPSPSTTLQHKLDHSHDKPLSAGLRRTLEAPANQPRRGGTDVSPGRKPWVSAPMEPSPVGTAEVGRELSPYVRIVVAETEREVLLTDVLRSHTLQSVTLAIGPEGGWTEDELQSFATSQWIAASLGETILRAETAAIAAIAIARAEI